MVVGVFSCSLEDQVLDAFLGGFLIAGILIFGSSAWRWALEETSCISCSPSIVFEMKVEPFKVHADFTRSCFFADRAR